MKEKPCQEIIKKETRGGARPGSGKKLTDKGRVVKRTISLYGEDWAALKAMGGYTVGIRFLLKDLNKLNIT